MLHKESPGLRQIITDLVGQGVEIGKSHFIAQLGKKADIKVGPVEVSIEVKQVNFE